MAGGVEGSEKKTVIFILHDLGITSCLLNQIHALRTSSAILLSTVCPMSTWESTMKI